MSANPFFGLLDNTNIFIFLVGVFPSIGYLLGLGNFFNINITTVVCGFKNSIYYSMMPYAVVSFQQFSVRCQSLFGTE